MAAGTFAERPARLVHALRCKFASFYCRFLPEQDATNQTLNEKNHDISSCSLVGATGIEPVTPTMSSKWT